MILALTRYLPAGLGIALLISLGTNYALWQRAGKVESDAAAELAAYKENHAEQDRKVAVAAAQAQQAAINLQNERWQGLLMRSQQSAREAQRNRQAAEEEARLLKIQLENIYDNDPDAETWRNAPIPDGVRGVLGEDEDHPT